MRAFVDLLGNRGRDFTLVRLGVKYTF